jgi:hypothetical protein
VIRGLLLGSTSQHVLRHSACPVTVVHDIVEQLWKGRRLAATDRLGRPYTTGRDGDIGPQRGVRRVASCADPDSPRTTR